MHGNTQLKNFAFLKFIICGSAASWIIKNIVSDKGGLHNRLTERIHLKPFTLRDTELFLKAQHIRIKRNDILKIYMVFGGIPYYLSLIRPW